MHPPDGDPLPRPGADEPGPCRLSAREAQVLHLIARGLSNQEIADAVFLSINSVKTYIRSAYREIGVSRRAQAVVWAIHHGLDGCGLDPLDGRDLPRSARLDPADRPTVRSTSRSAVQPSE